MQDQGQRGETHRSAALQLNCTHTHTHTLVFPHMHFFWLPFLEIATLRVIAALELATLCWRDLRGCRIKTGDVAVPEYQRQDPPNMPIERAKIHPSLPPSRISAAFSLQICSC